MRPTTSFPMETIRPTRIHVQQLQGSATIPYRYRVLLYLSIVFLVIDLGINTFSEYLATSEYVQLILFM